MKYGDINLSDSVDAQRMRQYIEACQAAVDAWQDIEIHIGWAEVSAQHGLTGSAIRHSQLAGAAQARARQAMWAAENAL